VSSVEDVAASLRSWFAARLETDDVEISELKRHAEGWS